INGIKGARRVVYNLPAIAAAPPERPVFIVEGEKDVETLTALELLATTNPMGAGKWTSELSDLLRGRHTFILPDNDDPGKRHAEAVAQSLKGIAASTLIVELPGLSAKGDISDWLAIEGNNKDKLIELVQSAVREQAKKQERTQSQEQSRDKTI